MEEFVRACGGKIKFKHNIPREVISKLPDFVIASKNGVIQFLEVKFRAKGYLGDEHKEVFEYFPTDIMVVNLSVEGLRQRSAGQAPWNKFARMRARFQVHLGFG
jgi:hypothetical protein